MRRGREHPARLGKIAERRLHLAPEISETDLADERTAALLLHNPVAIAEKMPKRGIAQQPRPGFLRGRRVSADVPRGFWIAQADRREEAVLALILLGSAGFIAVNEGPLNLEAMLWCGLTVLLALPGLGAWRGLLFRRKASGVAIRPA